MKKNKKVVIKFLVVSVLLLLSASLFNFLNKDSFVGEPEILVSQNYEQVKRGDEKVDNTDYVTFDAFYLRDLDGDGYAEKLRGTCREIGYSDTLYMDLNVLTNGTLKNAKITINGKNFYFATALVRDSVIAQDYISTNTREIRLNDVANGTQKLIFGLVRSGDYTYSGNIASAIGNDTNKYTVTDNTITLTGTHVADDGTETPITKTVNLTNDWYGTTRTTMSTSNQTYDINTALDEENSNVNIKFYIKTEETNKKLILKSQHTEIEIPEFNGYKATGVTVSNPDVIVNFDEENQKATLDLNSVINGSGVVTTALSRNVGYYVTVTYPYEAYELANEVGISLNFPIDEYYVGYNNKGAEFENPYKSNVAEGIITVLYSIPKGRETSLDIDVGNYVDSRYIISKSKPMNIYNSVDSEDEEDLYPVRWYVFAGENLNGKAITLKEQQANSVDKFLDVDGNYIDMTNYTSNVGIYFSGASSLLPDDGYIKVFNDETDELLHTFTIEDWNKYSSTNPYRYSEAVKHIRVETSATKDSASFYVYNVKVLDDVKITADFTEEEFLKLARIFSYLELYSEGSAIGNATSYAYYELPYSVANISLDPSTITNQETKEHVKINITTSSDNYIKSKWANGEFLIKYPEEIFGVNVNSVTSANRNVTVTGYDTYTENGCIYTKIYTSNDIESNVQLTLDVDLTADPRNPTLTRSIELYYYNPICDNYYNKTADIYDVNGNENVEEKVGKDTTSISLIAPSNILTSEDVTDFDDNTSKVFAPNVAEVDKSDESKTAKIEINVTNSYSNTISEVKIVGKIPYEGNTYQLNGKDMGSQFDTTMTSEGIIIPDELREYVTVYYSEKENVTEDINSRKNAWTTTPADMSKVKSYLIDLGEYVMPVNNTHVFSYVVNVPGGNSYNDVSYSDHAVYYCLDTDQGKLKTQTEPNKVGVKIALKYDLEITKYQRNTTIPVSETVFSAQEVGEENSTTAVTNANGIATIKNLYVEKEYIIKEIKANSNYILDDTETTIVAHVVDGQIQIEVTGGNFKTTPVVEAVENANAKVKTTIENEVKYNLELNKTQTVTNDAIQGIRFELTDYNGKTKRYTTNVNGIINLKKLEPNKQYQLTEVSANGYYLKESVTFMVIRDENDNLKLNVISGEFDGNPIINIDGEIPLVQTSMENEKVPTYSLRVTKKEADTENTIPETQFKIEGDGKSTNSTYETDENGQMIISGLYQYVEGKAFSGEYTLTETFPGVGYVINDEPVKFKLNRDVNNNVSFELISGTIREEVENVQIDTTNPENPIVDITVDNEPVFTLTKIDGENGGPMEGIVFHVTDMDGNYDIKDANGNPINYDEVTEIELNSGGTYPWSQNDDGTWQSGNYNISSSTSTLTSNEFTIEDDAILSFEWSVSSQSTYDYLYYKITNLETGRVIGGTSNKISGTSYGNSYTSLKFDNINEKLSAGIYIIEFYYYKNSNTNTGLDRGYIKNIKVMPKNIGVTTDTNGKIKLSLKDGLYRLIEAKAPDGYELNTTEIGINESRRAEYELVEDKKYNNQAKYGVTDAELNGDEIVAVCKNGQIIKYYLDGKVKSINNCVSIGNCNCISVAENGYAVAGRDSYRSYISWRNLDGDVIWEITSSTNIQYNDVLAENDGIIAIGSSKNSQGQYFKRIIKYDYSGNIVFNKEYNIGTYLKMIKYEDGYIISSSNGGLTRFDNDFNIIWENSELVQNNYKYKGFVVYENYCYVIDTLGNNLVIFDTADGEIVYNQTVDFLTEGNYNISAFVKLTDGLLGITMGGDSIKYDFDGNLIYIDKSKSRRNSYVYNGKAIGTNLENEIFLLGIISGVESSEIMKCTSSINVLWRKNIANYNIIKTIFKDNNIITVDNAGLIVKYNEQGNVEKYTSDSDGLFTQCIECNDGIILIGNSCINKYDYNCQQIWKKNEDVCIDCKKVLLLDSGFIAINSTYAYKYDSNGNLLWKKYFSDRIVDIKIDDGKIIIFENSTAYHVYDFNGNIILNSDNNQIRGTDMLTSNNKTAITIDEDDVYLAYHKMDRPGSSSSGYNHIVKYSNGELVWDKEFDTYTTDLVINKLFMVDNGIIAVTGSYIILMDFDGNTVWKIDKDDLDLYYLGFADYFVERIVSDGIIFVGNSKSTQSSSTYPIILKLDFEGNILWSYVDKLTLNGGYARDIIEKDGLYFISIDSDTRYEHVCVLDLNGNPVCVLSEMDEKCGTLRFVTDDRILMYNNLQHTYLKLNTLAPEITSSTNITIENYYKKFKITTQVDGIGGSISGENDEVYEEVKYKENSLKDIIAIPENGYKVSGIIINGINTNFTEKEDGTVELEKFYNMNEDKHIIVSFVKVDNSLIINKKDSTNDNPLKNARFNIKQIEYRNEPESINILNNIISSGKEYYYSDLDNPINEVIGEKQDKEDYYFTLNEEGKYESNNGGTDSSTANSYFEIDLTEYTGKYNLVVNANVSSQADNDFGYAVLSNSSEIKPYGNSYRRFINISGTSTTVTAPKDYSITLDGGDKYYLHIGYYKNASNSTGDDKFTINSINIYPATTNIFSFVDNGNGGYESNNQGQASTVANSYIPVDLTGYKGQYNLIVNANVSSQYADYGYATITDNTDAPLYSDTIGRFIYISGTSTSVTTPKDYSTVLEGGKMYYLHFGYYKNASTDSGEDKFTINSINLTLNQDDFLQDTEIVTNSSGQASIELKDGRYEITEIDAPEGYKLDSSKITYDFVSGQENEITVYNTPYNAKVIVHHYIKDTTTSLADDEEYEGVEGDEYSTSPRLDLDRYQLVKDENGDYVLPDNASGTYTLGIQEVTYYYELKPLELIVHHYLDGTETSVAPDENSEGTEGEEYTTHEVDLSSYEVIEEKYPENASGTLTEPVTEVTYYYREVIIEHKITTEVDGAGGTISGENENPYESVIHTYNSQKDIVITPDTGYRIKDITINGNEYTSIVNSGKEVVNQKINLNELANETKGELTSNGTYYFVDNDGVYTSNNNGVNSSVANSYIEIDLTDYSGDYAVVVNAKVSSESNYDYGYATITENITAPSYSAATGQFIKIAGTTTTVTTPKDYIALLTGGKKYYLHLGYRKDGSGNSGTDKFTINSVNVYSANVESQTIAYSFIENGNGGFESNNQGVPNTTANSYIPIDLTGYTGSYNLIVNANVSSQSGDYGYATVNTSTTSPAYNASSGRFIYMSGTSTTYTTPKDYSTTLTGGRMYYLHLGYYKNGSTDSGEDKFTVNSIRLEKAGTEGEQINIQAIPEEKDMSTSFVMSRFNDVTEDKHIVVSFEIIRDNINIEKVWNDNDDEKEKRPDSVIVELYNGSTLVESGEIKASENWKYSFENIPMYDEQGNPIIYTIREKEKYTNDLELYNSVITTEDNKNFVITNGFEIPDETKDIVVNKVWEDNNDENSKRPEKIKLQLKNGETVLQEQEINVTGNTQTYTFEDLPLYDVNTGDYIGYTVDEVESNTDDLKFYSKQISQPANSNIVTITNTYTVPDEKINVNVTKRWEDNSNNGNTRPAQIKLQVKDGNTVVQEQVVNVDNTTNEKVYEFTDLPKYDSLGNEINYVADEVEVREDELASYSKEVSGTTVINTLEKHKITTEVNGTGGTISGEGENPYEEVNHKADSVKDIVITPSEGYKIKSITINDEEQSLPNDVYHTYTLPKFEEMTEDKHIVVEFELVEHVITTEVDGVGGTISGQGSTKQNPYESVVHGNNSVKDIIVTPNAGYKISSITINDVEQDLPSNVNEAYTLPKFTNMTEDKHIVVSFEHRETSVVVKHQTEDGTDLVEPQVINGRVDDEYTTSPREFDDYDLKTVPDNAEGTMTVEQIEVVYVYSKVLGKVTVTKQDRVNTETKLNGAIFKLEKLDSSDEVDTSFEAVEVETTGEGENKGKAEFNGLEVGKYRITEIKAPEGYELTGEPVDVEVTKAQREVNITASDRMSLDLPATGGINYTILISVIGFVIMLSSTGIVILKKKQ